MNKITQEMILIVENNTISSAILKKILQRKYKLDVAINGQEALEKIAQYIPDLILLDIEMPVLNGWETFERLKKNEKTSDIPVIIVTGRTDVASIEKAFRVGVADYIAKPFHVRELTIRIEKTLYIKESKKEIQHWQQRMLQELRLASNLQETIMSTKPVYTENFDIYWDYQPSIEIGGDAFDVIQCSNRRVCIYVADISGHGVASAMMACMIKALLAEILHSNFTSTPADICNKLEARVHTNIPNTDMYLTLLLMIHEPDWKHWQCISCGHHPPLIYLDGKRVFEQETASMGGVPIGLNLISGQEYTFEDEAAIPFIPGMKLIAFTDGIVEAFHQETGKQYEIEHVLSQCSRTVKKDISSRELSENLLQSMKEEGYHLMDDCTIAVIDVVSPEVIKWKKNIPMQEKKIRDYAKNLSQCLEEEGWDTLVADMVGRLMKTYAMNVLRQHSKESSEPISVVLRVYDSYCLILFMYKGIEWAFEESVRSAYENKSSFSSTQDGDLALIVGVTDHIQLFRHGGQHWGVFQINQRCHQKS